MQSRKSITKLRELVGYRSSSPDSGLLEHHEEIAGTKAIEDSQISGEAVINEDTNASAESPFSFEENPAAIEERNGEIEVRVVNNDGQRESTIILTGAKNVFQQQLPNMPKAYIARLAYDRSHTTIVVIQKPLEVLGGITYRVFSEQQFIEIVFCAIAPGYQTNGYGAHLMAHLKDFIKASMPDMYDFLTYADNKAIPWFKKQGFTTDVTLPPQRWQGYIKDYEGSTRMQRTMLPKIRYLEVRRMLAMQKAFVKARITAASPSSFQVHAPPTQWKTGLKEIDPMSIPVIRNSGWSPAMDESSRMPTRNAEYTHMMRLLGDLAHDSNAWPFGEPVDKDIPGYYDVIKDPICIADIQKKFDDDEYECMKDMVADFKLMFKNCRTFNPSKSVYFRAASQLEKVMWTKLRETGDLAYLEAEFAGK